MDHATEQKSKTLFWYNILYLIGSHVIDVARRKYPTTFELPQSDNPWTEIFCGYWILNLLSQTTTDDSTK